MRNCSFILIPLSFLIVACISNSSNVRMNEKYQAYKNEFDTLLTSHFPKTILSYPNQIINSKHVSKNDVGFLLYEYGLDTLKVDSLDEYYEKRAIATYNAGDTCLLIVNRFETIETFENRKEITAIDQKLVDRSCYKVLYPIPNFISYRERVTNKPMRLNENFTIYVLQAQAGIRLKSFDLQPSDQMPKAWENGYSKGIAISKKNNTVVYWGIIW